MPRISRKDLKSCYFHIIIQGINREYIFKENYLKKLYKNILKEKLEETDIKILNKIINQKLWNYIDKSPVPLSKRWYIIYKIKNRKKVIKW